jgi:hypothetical protein
MSHAAQVVNRAGKLMFAVILVSILVAILFGSFGLILPDYQWTVWRVPILTTAGITMVYQMTDSAILSYLLCCAFIPTVPGAVGVWITRRRLREAGRTSLPGMAARFSALGLGLSAMIGVMVAVAALYRRVTWP